MRFGQARPEQQPPPPPPGPQVCVCLGCLAQAGSQCRDTSAGRPPGSWLTCKGAPKSRGGASRWSPPCPLVPSAPEPGLDPRLALPPPRATALPSRGAPKLLLVLAPHTLHSERTPVSASCLPHTWLRGEVLVLQPRARHHGMHSGQRGFPLPACSKCFTRRDSLPKLARHHSASAVTPPGAWGPTQHFAQQPGGSRANSPASALPLVAPSAPCSLPGARPAPSTSNTPVVPADFQRSPEDPEMPLSPQECKEEA